MYGDKEAIAEMIAVYDDTAKPNWDRMRAMKDLIASGAPEAIRHVIEQFGRIYYPDVCVSTTPQYEITIALAYNRPGDSIFNEELSKAQNAGFTFSMPTIPKAEASSEDKKKFMQEFMEYKRTLREEGPGFVAEYYKKLYAWMYDNYNVQPLDPPPYTYFKQPCRSF